MAELIRYPYEEMTRVVFVPEGGITDITGPTTAELDDGDVVDITCLLTIDGLNPGGSANKTEGPTLCSKVRGQAIGSIGYDMNLKGYRDRAVDGDAFWNLVNWGDAGFLVVRRGVAFDDVWADGQNVEVYQVQFSDPVMDGTGQDTNQTFTVATAVEAAEIKAVVGGGS